MVNYAEISLLVERKPHQPTRMHQLFELMCKWNQRRFYSIFEFTKCHGCINNENLSQMQLDELKLTKKNFYNYPMNMVGSVALCGNNDCLFTKWITWRKKLCWPTDLRLFLYSLAKYWVGSGKRESSDVERKYWPCKVGIKYSSINGNFHWELNICFLMR